MLAVESDVHTIGEPGEFGVGSSMNPKNKMLI